MWGERMIRTQKQAVENHLRNIGGLTQADATERYGIQRLSQYIHLLRREGWDIVSITRTGKNRFGNNSNWVEYRLQD